MTLHLTTTTTPDGAPTLHATGEIDMATVDTFRAAVATALPDDGPLLVDLTAVTYLDSAGLSVLFTHADRLRLVISTLLRPVATVSGLDEVVSIDVSE